MLDGSKNWYEICQVNVCGERLSANIDAVSYFKIEMDSSFQGYIKDQIYNADETGLNFKMLLKKSLASRDEKSAAGTH